MLEHFMIQALESELQTLYKSLESTTDIEEKERIQQAIQQHNLRLVRLCPNE